MVYLQRRSRKVDAGTAGAFTQQITIDEAKDLAVAETVCCKLRAEFGADARWLARGQRDTRPTPI
jgi:hypothetical protein